MKQASNQVFTLYSAAIKLHRLMLHGKLHLGRKAASEVRMGMLLFSEGNLYALEIIYNSRKAQFSVKMKINSSGQFNKPNQNIFILQ